MWGDLANEARLADPESRLQHALDLSYRYLGHRDRTAAEVRRHLESRRVDPAAIDAAVTELLRLGYLDDARFAQRFAEDRRTLDAWGHDRIARKLATHGVEADLIEAALARRDAAEELDAALAVLHRRFPNAPRDDRERERALGLLVRKGYPAELAYEAIRRYGRDATR